ncbi:MAG TPA: hypothetical protein VHQ87_07030, partial [Rhizobacter sp.]|nr:hypothetical protein [Rhizobacter sp.]
MVQFVDVHSPRGTSLTFSFSGEASFDNAASSVPWTAYVSTEEGQVALRGVAVDVRDAWLTKSVAMQAVRDALDVRFGTVPQL